MYIIYIPYSLLSNRMDVIGFAHTDDEAVKHIKEFLGDEFREEFFDKDDLHYIMEDGPNSFEIRSGWTTKYTSPNDFMNKTRKRISARADEL